MLPDGDWNCRKVAPAEAGSASATMRAEIKARRVTSRIRYAEIPERANLSRGRTAGGALRPGCRARCRAPPEPRPGRFPGARGRGRALASPRPALEGAGAAAVRAPA